uniref:Uncharacterized protein n=1 Tax=Panagrolaimus superbus TaxID=310955 RepID=A0A914YSR9_9BILA
MGAANFNFCGMQILDCARIVAIIGIIISIISIVSSFVFTNFTSIFMDVCLLAAYGMSFYAVHKKRQTLLYPALIVLGVNMFLLLLAIIILLTISPMGSDQGIKRDHTVTIIIAVLELVFAGFSFFIFHNARKYLLQILFVSFSMPSYPQENAAETPMTPQTSTLIGLHGMTENAKVIS